MPGCAQYAQDVPPTPSVMQRAASRGFVLVQIVRGCMREGGYGQPWTGLLNVWGHIAVVPLSPVESHDCFCKALSIPLHCSVVALWSGVGNCG